MQQKIHPNKSTSITYLITLLIFFSLFSYKSSAQAQSSDPSPLHFPEVKNIRNMLFYLQRDPNTNTLIYALNLERDGKINKSQPILAYWIRYAENSEKKELNYIQRKFAYGIATKELTPNHFEFSFVSHKKLAFYLNESGKDKQYQVTVTLNDKKIVLRRIFIRIDGGSFWLPKVKYALIEGIDSATGKETTERITVK